MKAIYSVAFFLASLSLMAANKPESDWLINPEAKDSAVVEVWPSNRPNHFIWRLRTHSGEVLTEMEEPEVPDSYEFNNTTCTIDGQPRFDIVVAIKVNENEQYSSEFIGAWLASPSKRAFIKVQPKTVICLNESYGI